MQKNNTTKQTTIMDMQSPTPVGEIHNNFSTETIASNQWYSSIYKTFPSQQMFAFPLAYQLSENGVGFSLPKVNKTSETIYGSYIEDFTVGLQNKVSKPAIRKIGNWSIDLQMNTITGKSIAFTLAQGVPSTTIYTNDEQIVLRFKEPYTIYNTTSDALGITIHGNNYILVFPANSTVTKNQKEIRINTKQLFVAALDKPENFTLFKNHANATITDTFVTWNTTEKNLEVTYEFIGKDMPLITLLPHQYENLKEKFEVFGTYQSLRGTLYLVTTKTFTTTLPLIIPDTTFTPLKAAHSDFRSALKEDYQKIMNDNQPDNGDYFLGAWYGKAANILLLLDAAGMKQEKQALLEKLEPKLLRSLNYFRYQKDKQSVIADKPEFGNENLNDHHFHYGYFIRTAAVLSQLDPTYKNKADKYITQLIGDIASTDRNATQFPFLRNFDVYEGHSWADGFANFGDGNNQESSSESIGAWYSVYLWAKTTGDIELEKTALYLYNTEINSTLYYWFGKNSMYTKPYNHAIGTIVWGGKIDFATWFSGETNMKYGIQILPITPGSFGYLGKLTNFTKYETDFYNSGGAINKEWGDLFVVLTSFYNPQKALTLKNQVIKSEENNPKSLFFYTLYRNNNQ